MGGLLVRSQETSTAMVAVTSCVGQAIHRKIDCSSAKGLGTTVPSRVVRQLEALTRQI